MHYHIRNFSWAEVGVRSTWRIKAWQVVEVYYYISIQIYIPVELYTGYIHSTVQVLGLYIWPQQYKYIYQKPKLGFTV